MTKRNYILLYYDKCGAHHNILELVLGPPFEKELKTTMIPKIW
jgi:hypothetical protein